MHELIIPMIKNVGKDRPYKETRPVKFFQIHPGICLLGETSLHLPRIHSTTTCFERVFLSCGPIEKLLGSLFLCVTTIWSYLEVVAVLINFMLEPLHLT